MKYFQPQHLHEDSMNSKADIEDEGIFNNDIFFVGVGDLGYGLFAKRRINSGEFILIFTGERIDFAAAQEKGEWQCYPLQVAPRSSPGSYIDLEPPSVYGNHSCNPNSGIINDNMLVAIRTIEEGEEIRYDYSTTIDEDGGFEMKCACKSNRCRKVISDFETIPAEVQKEYLQRGIVQRFIAEQFTD